MVTAEAVPATVLLIVRVTFVFASTVTTMWYHWLEA